MDNPNLASSPPDTLSPPKRKRGRPRKNPLPEEKEKKRANPEWLRAFNFENLTAEQRYEYARRSNETRKANNQKKASFKQALEMFLDMPLLDGGPVAEALKPIFPNITNRDAMSLILIAKGVMEGDIKAFETIRDTVGEAPARQLAIQNTEPMVITVQTISPDSPSPATIIDVTPDSPQLTSPSVAPVQQEYSNNA